MNISLAKYNQNINLIGATPRKKAMPSTRFSPIKNILSSDIIMHYSLTPDEQEKQRRKRKATNIATAILLPLAVIGLYTIAIKGTEKLLLQKFGGNSAKEQSHKSLKKGIAGNVKTVKLTTQNNLDIECWDINPKKSHKYVIFCHGNGQHLSQSQDIYKEILNKGYGVFAVDYAGYAGNKGNVTEKNLMLDGQAAYDYLTKKKHISPKQIGVMGYSLGGAVATDIASKNDCKFVILLDTFNNFVDAARNAYGYFNISMPKPLIKLLNALPSWILPINNTFRSDKKIKNINAPITIIHAKNDNVIPIELARKLQNKAVKNNQNLQFVTLSEGNHFYDNKKYQAVRNALSKY